VHVTVKAVLPVLDAALDKYVDITRGMALTAQLSTTVTETPIVPVAVAAAAAFGATNDVASRRANALRPAARPNLPIISSSFWRSRHQTSASKTPPECLAT
jgi:hypothetical protein